MPSVNCLIYILFWSDCALRQSQSSVASAQPAISHVTVLFCVHFYLSKLRLDDRGAYRRMLTANSKSSLSGLREILGFNALLQYKTQILCVQVRRRPIQDGWRRLRRRSHWLWYHQLMVQNRMCTRMITLVRWVNCTHAAEAQENRIQHRSVRQFYSPWTYHHGLAYRSFHQEGRDLLKMLKWWISKAASWSSLPRKEQFLTAHGLAVQKFPQASVASFAPHSSN